jgi:hypothetical protein
MIPTGTRSCALNFARISSAHRRQLLFGQAARFEPSAIWPPPWREYARDQFPRQPRFWEPCCQAMKWQRCRGDGWAALFSKSRGTVGARRHRGYGESKDAECAAEIESYLPGIDHAVGSPQPRKRIGNQSYLTRFCFGSNLQRKVYTHHEHCTCDEERADWRRGRYEPAEPPEAEQAVRRAAQGHSGKGHKDRRQDSPSGHKTAG